MNILQTVKYYDPSTGGMESVVKNIVEGIIDISPEYSFTVYSNNHLSKWKQQQNIISPQETIIKEFTPFIIKSQPLSIRYSSLPKLISSCDLIHHHYPFPNMELALLRNFKLVKEKKLIITWHADINNSRWGFIKKYYNPVIYRFLDIADHIIVTSPQLYEASDILKKYEAKIKVIPLSFSPFIKTDIAFKTLNLNKPKQVLFVGKLRSYKGLTYLIEAIKHLDVILTIVGEGEDENNLKYQVNNSNLNAKVKFIGNASDQELLGIYKNADIFVLPSINEAEAFGVVQLEAMANGLPVINTRLSSGVPFVSLNEITGLTVEPKNSVELAIAINRIINDADFYVELSKNCILRSKLFTREQMAQSYINLYKS